MRYEPRKEGDWWLVYDTERQEFIRFCLCINPMEAQVIADLKNKKEAQARDAADREHET